MSSNLAQFGKTFEWYRNISIQLLEEFPTKLLSEQVSTRSLCLAHQFIDLGEMELRVLERITKKKYNKKIAQPNAEKTNGREIIKYLTACHALFLSEVEHIPNKDECCCNWFDRMHFDLSEALTFLIAHEAMHHGEILSFIQTKNLPMPKILQRTWGFE